MKYIGSIINYYLGLLFYVIRHPLQTPGLVKQTYSDSINRFRRRRVCEYIKYKRSDSEALTYISDVRKDNLDSLPPAEALRQFSLEVQELAARDASHIPSAWDADTTLAILAYKICRIIQPELVVETGVAHGITSAYILHALEENRKGHLYSIDLPAFKQGSEKFIGNAIPERLKNRWTLMLGLSNKVLPGLLSRLGKIDMFLHDSDHSYHNQKMEYNISWKYLKHGGVLLSDDVNNSDAFIEFAERQNIQPITITQPDKDLLIGLLERPLEYFHGEFFTNE